MPFYVCLYRILWYFITALSKQDKPFSRLWWDGMGWGRAFPKGSEGLLTCARALLKQRWSYSLLILVWGTSRTELWRLFWGAVSPFFL